MQTANRVAFNTVVNYIQLVLSVVIGLVSVRLILAALGKVDYGIYDVVGGVVSLLSFVATSLAQASMRFISVSLGKNDIENIRKTFRTCFWLHVSVAIILSIIVEIVGLFLFDGYLDIPENRIFAAKVIYHCVTVTLFLNIVQTPFRALINSHEKFWYTSIIGILNSVLKLLIAIIITYWFVDKLIVYGILLALITVIDFFLIAGYVTYLYRDQISIKEQLSAR
jgi:Na+-driven multidrug efflux pump